MEIKHLKHLSNELRDLINEPKSKFTKNSGICYKCKQTKTIQEFSKRKISKITGRTTLCKKCDNERRKQFYQKTGK